jgi:hypothetical protein
VRVRRPSPARGPAGLTPRVTCAPGAVPAGRRSCRLRRPACPAGSA